MKYLVTALLSFATLHFAYAGDVDKTGRTITMANGNRIAFTQPEEAIVSVTDKITGKRIDKSFDKIQERPYTLNGKAIVYDHKTTPELEHASVQMYQQIKEGLNSHIDKLPEGCYEYLISNISR